MRAVAGPTCAPFLYPRMTASRSSEEVFGIAECLAAAADEGTPGRGFVSGLRTALESCS